MRAVLLTTCVAEVFDPAVAEATVDVLTAGGCDVVCPEGQTCCGQPAWNSGFAEDAARVASTTLDALDAALQNGADVVVVPAGSCAAMVRVFWPELFATVGDQHRAEAAVRVAERTWELTELVPHLELPPLALAEPTTVAWHHSCHLLRELGHRAAPDVLDDVAGCERTEWSADERCCGFGGLFSVKQPEVSVAMADDKLRSLADAAPAPTELVSADTSCLLHLRGRLEAEQPVALAGVRTRHVAQVLAAALPPSAPDSTADSTAASTATPSAGPPTTAR